MKCRWPNGIYLHISKDFSDECFFFWVIWQTIFPSFNFDFVFLFLIFYLSYLFQVPNPLLYSVSRSSSASLLKLSPLYFLRTLIFKRNSLSFHLRMDYDLAGILLISRSFILDQLSQGKKTHTHKKEEKKGQILIHEQKIQMERK